VVVCGKKLRTFPLKGKFCCNKSHAVQRHWWLSWVFLPVLFLEPSSFKRDQIKKQRCAYNCQANQRFASPVSELLVLAVSFAFLELGIGTEAEVGR